MTEEYKPPAYGTPGWVLVQVVEVNPPGSVYRYTIEESAVDTEHSPYWIQEGVGIDFWLDHCGPDDLTVGWWVFECVVGTYFKGEWGYTDDDEDWEYKSYRPATQEEQDTLSVKS
jgi:hypothetical protein